MDTMYNGGLLSQVVSPQVHSTRGYLPRELVRSSSPSSWCIVRVGAQRRRAALPLALLWSRVPVSQRSVRAH